MPNKHPAKWTEEETYEVAFLKCVELSQTGDNGIRQCGWVMPHQFKDESNFELRRAWIRGWQDARS